MTQEEKDWIDTTSYESLLFKWRFEPTGSGSPWFEGETGKYYAKVLAERRAADPEGHVRASKHIGWER